MKDDRDKNLVVKNNDGATVNRWLTTGFLAASATTNETAAPYWHSTTKHAFDTAQRWPVWPQHSAVVR